MDAHRHRPRAPRRSGLLAAAALASCALLGLDGCVATPRARKAPALAYSVDDFRATVRERVPGISDELAEPPFAIDEGVVARARKVIEAAPLGNERVQALVDFLGDPEPRGLGLTYDWAVSTHAMRTLELRRGNCFALASVLVGLGRGLGWPIFYAEARPTRPTTLEFEDVTAISDHMVVIVVARTVRMVIDFAGEVEPGKFQLHPIDDITSYAHLINNIAGQRVMAIGSKATDADWQAALEGFQLATRLQPRLGRAWNNLGIVYSHLGRFEEAREAYHRSLELNTAFGSTERNLSIMETKARGATTLLSSPRSRSDGLESSP